MAYFELLVRCRWLSHTISMAEGFSRATQSMPIAGSFCGYIAHCCTIEILWENVATSSATTKNSDRSWYRLWYRTSMEYRTAPPWSIVRHLYGVRGRTSAVILRATYPLVTPLIVAP